MDHLKAKIREIPDFPKKGNPLLRHHHAALRRPGLPRSVDALAAPYMGEDIDRLSASRAADSSWPPSPTPRLRLRARSQAGKLPAPPIARPTASNMAQRARDSPGSVREGQRILIVDDVLATRGTAKASIDSREKRRKIIGVAFLIELDFLNGRSKLPGEPVFLCCVLDWRAWQELNLRPPLRSGALSLSYSATLLSVSRI